MSIVFTKKNFFIIVFIIALFLLCLSIVELFYDINYHEILNPDLYSLNYNNNNNNKIQSLNIYLGQQIANNSKIVICSLARNISNVFEKTKVRLEYIGSQFNEYKIIIFENDSSDNSRDLIKKWVKANNNVILLECCNLNNCECKLKNKTGYEYGSFSSNRLSKMALYREQYLNYVKKYFNYYDYMLVIDFDLDGNIDINGLYDSLTYENWSAIFCNGRVPVPFTLGMKTISYDAIAFLSIDESYNHKNFKMSDFLKKYNYMEKITNNDTNSNTNINNLVEVKSAFNGCGIYKINLLKKCSYIGDEKNCEHVNLAKCLHDNGHKIFINVKWYGYFNRQGDNVIKTTYNLMTLE